MKTHIKVQHNKKMSSILIFNGFEHIGQLELYTNAQVRYVVRTGVFSDVIYKGNNKTLARSATYQLGV